MVSRVLKDITTFVKRSSHGDWRSTYLDGNSTWTVSVTSDPDQKKKQSKHVRQDIAEKPEDLSSSSTVLKAGKKEAVQALIEILKKLHYAEYVYELRDEHGKWTIQVQWSGDPIDDPRHEASSDKIH
jgi:hypothetical protein